MINTCDDIEHPFIEYLTKEIVKLGNVTENKAIEWLDSKPRGLVLYVSFGSLQLKVGYRISDDLSNVDKKDNIVKGIETLFEDKDMKKRMEVCEIYHWTKLILSAIDIVMMVILA
ncbi:hypothetical protein ACOSQ4_003317 [Xanthoceras sorbifolium]